MIMEKKRIIITALVIISFVLLISSILFLINKYREQRMLDPLELEAMQKEQILQKVYEKQGTAGKIYYYFIPIAAFFGLAVGALVFYILSGDLEKKDKIIKYDTDIILKLLTPEERKIVKKIVESEGKVQQAEITYMEGYTKVRAHRIVESLGKKGILTKEKLGKINVIRMNKGLYDILKDDNKKN
jgi:hypothetical protein